MPYLTAVLSAERAGLAGALSLGTAPLAAPFGDLAAFSRLSLRGIANSTVAGVSTAVPAGSTEIGDFAGAALVLTHLEHCCPPIPR